MASYVVVITQSLKRATVKTNAGTYLSDVVSEARQKLGLRNEQYELRYNKKTLDLSLQYRHANLPPGASVELVQASRSPTVVNVALQIAETRLTEKFASTTSIWKILRHFEDKSGNAAASNLTQRGVPKPDSGSTGGGRLYYETPIVRVANRELSTFEDLQKTLVQFGLNGGSALLRLSFRETQRPLEEAMAEISQYFESIGEASSVPGPATTGSHDEPALESSSAAAVAEPDVPSKGQRMGTCDVLDSKPLHTTLNPEEPSFHRPSIGTPEPAYTAQSNLSPSKPSSTTADPSTAEYEVFTIASSQAPQAANIPHNPADYEPGLDQARAHQAHLTDKGRNKRLPSDKEIAEQEQAKAERLAAIPLVKIRVRFPDQMLIQRDFSRTDTAATLYDFVRGALERPTEPFLLRNWAVTITDGPDRLIGKLGFQGNMLVTFVWGDGASAEARRGPSLKSNIRAKAEDLKVDTPAAELEPVMSTPTQTAGNATKRMTGGSMADKEAKFKKLLGFGKKK